MQSVTILGATGSIGESTLDVLSRHPDRYRVYALTANASTEKLFEQIQSFQPEIAVMQNRDAAAALRTRVASAGLSTEVLAGETALADVAAADASDIVVAAIVGAAGLMPTIAAARAGKRILLANKEALVMSGDLFMREVVANQATLLPVDSEHNAIWQCMPVGETQHYDFGNHGVRRILLTASGGPFRDWPVSDLVNVTPEQAVAHPNWSMGQKISVDSATMMNKGLEVIEAHWLFGLPPAQIEVVLHRQSVIHSMVDYVDGSVMAQMGNPDMRTPIANTLAWPERIDSGVKALDLIKAGRLDFAEADFDRFPCLKLAYEALETGGTATAILNAANEEAVSAFLAGELSFTGIAGIIARVLEHVPAQPAHELAQVLAADNVARSTARRFIQTH